MNRIILTSDECGLDGTVTLTDERAEHIRTVLKARVGDEVRTGVLNGLIGISRVERMDEQAVVLRTQHDEQAPEPWFDLILAAPRPKVLKRLWPQLAALGTGRIVILNASKVEKCYFSSQWIDPAYYTPLLVEGLMQAGTTSLPDVQIKQRFKPFMEDELEACFPNALRLLAHPGEASGHGWKLEQGQRPLLAIGPEGGWTDYELDMFLKRGFTPFSLGSRPLRTDTATIALVAVLQERLLREKGSTVC
ncbi:MAG: RsmE family RNA methyltransferase [bacterium]